MPLRLFYRFLTIVLLLLPSLQSVANSVIVFQQGDRIINIGKNSKIYEDPTGTLSADEVLHQLSSRFGRFEVLNLGLSTSTFWVEFTVKNLSDHSLILQLSQPTIDYVGFYEVDKSGMVSLISETGEVKPFNHRKYDHHYYIFDLDVPMGGERTYLVKVWSRDQITVPLSIGTKQHVIESLMKKDFVLGAFFGVIMIMFFYNIFIYFTVKDKSYLYYVAYILLLTLSQATLQGYAFRFFWPGSPWLAQHAAFIFPSLASIAAMLFAKVFLQTGSYVPKLDRGLIAFIGVFVLSIIIGIMGYYKASFAMMQNCTLLGSLYVIWLAVMVYKKGQKSAQFFLFAWSALLLGATVLVLRDYGVFLTNTFTSNTLLFGSAIEVVLLSFALSDKINTLRKEKEEAQGQMLLAYAENERIIKQQNLILETKVRERTIELQASNEDLNKTLAELKETQTQLVESEKMASLGQLTAGIAHEINNPINFVTANVKPLQRDITLLSEAFEKIEELAVADLPMADKQQQIAAIKEDIEYDYLKTEIEFLLKGISEGSTRTAEIVKGLRVFSRVDEDDLKKASIHDGLDSTLVIINSLLNNRITVTRDYQPDMPMIECYPGKLNQVFLNIITNAIHAINKRWDEREGGNVHIQTLLEGEEAVVLISDNGTGMDEETANHIFEPFFTTKDVGEGTGLGLSIVYNIIRKHNGTITVRSTLGEGTTFVIRVPVSQQTI